MVPIDHYIKKKLRKKRAILYWDRNLVTSDQLDSILCIGDLADNNVLTCPTGYRCHKVWTREFKNREHGGTEYRRFRCGAEACANDKPDSDGWYFIAGAREEW